MRMTKTGLVSCLMISLAFTLPATAQLSRDGGRTQIGADSLAVAERESRAVYIGAVDVVQGDARLRADQLTINFAGDPNSAEGGGLGDIETMLAEGNVFYITPDLRARGNQATYDAATETIVLDGEVIISRCGDVAMGEKLVLNTVTGESTLDGGGDNGGRVVTVITPDEEDDENQGDAPKECEF